MGWARFGGGERVRVMNIRAHVTSMTPPVTENAAYATSPCTCTCVHVCVRVSVDMCARLRACVRAHLLAADGGAAHRVLPLVFNPRVRTASVCACVCARACVRARVRMFARAGGMCVSVCARARVPRRTHPLPSKSDTMTTKGTCDCLARSRPRVINSVLPVVKLHTMSGFCSFHTRSHTLAASSP